MSHEDHPNQELTKQLDNVVIAYLSMGDFAAELIKAKYHSDPKTFHWHAMSSTHLFIEQVNKLNQTLKEVTNHLNKQ